MGTRPLREQLHAWLVLERSHAPDGSATAKALNYSPNHWPVLTHQLLDGEVSIDNNSIENLVRPWAMGRKAWLPSIAQRHMQQATVAAYGQRPASGQQNGGD